MNTGIANFSENTITSMLNIEETHGFWALKFCIYNVPNKISNHQWKDQMQALPSWPRREAVAQFRLATGHDCLAKHLHHIGILRSPNCTLCKQGIMDSNHLNICSALTSITLTDRYWEAREKMMAAIPQ